MELPLQLLQRFQRFTRASLDFSSGGVSEGSRLADGLMVSIVAFGCDILTAALVAVIGDGFQASHGNTDTFWSTGGRMGASPMAGSM